MKCSFCDETSESGKWDNLAAGWRAIEVYGKHGNKYIVACPKEAPKSVGDRFLEALDNVTKGTKK